MLPREKQKGLIEIRYEYYLEPVIQKVISERRSNQAADKNQQNKITG